MESSKIEKLVDALAVHQILMISLTTLFIARGLSTNEFKQSMSEAMPLYDVYKKGLMRVLGMRWSPSKTDKTDNERMLWESLGIGDMWGPSTDDSPQKP